MTSPDDTHEPRSASAGTTRTPPPRTRRGAPTTRSSFEELDVLDGILVPEADDADDATAAPAPVEPTPTRTRKRTRDTGPSPAPGSS
jgi:hypothetical protein